MPYIIKITAEVIDPQDPDYVATNDAVVEVSKLFGCKRSMSFDGDLEVGFFEFAKLDDVQAFRNHPTHRAAMAKVDKFYRRMRVERNWR